MNNIDFEECNESEATHVQIIPDKKENYKFCNVTVNKVYRILEHDEEDFDGEEMIQADNGDFICNFSLFLNVKWIKIRS
jgi:hypothetical protein